MSEFGLSTKLLSDSGHDRLVSDSNGKRSTDECRLPDVQSCLVDDGCGSKARVATHSPDLSLAPFRHQPSAPQASTPATFMPWKPAREAALRVTHIGTSSTPAAGIDAASMARRCQNPLPNPESISLGQPTKLPGGRVGGGRCAGEHATWAGTRDGWLRHPKRGPDTARGQHIEESPLNPAVQAGFRWPLSRSNAPRPACRPRHARMREANHVNAPPGPSPEQRLRARSEPSQRSARPVASAKPACAKRTTPPV